MARKKPESVSFVEECLAKNSAMTNAEILEAAKKKGLKVNGRALGSVRAALGLPASELTGPAKPKAERKKRSCATPTSEVKPRNGKPTVLMGVSVAGSLASVHTQLAEVAASMRSALKNIEGML